MGFAPLGVRPRIEEFAYVPSQRIERTEALLGAGRRARLASALDGLRSRFDDGAASVGQALRASIEAGQACRRCGS